MNVSTVRRIVRDKSGGRSDARHYQQEGIREIPWSHKKVSPSLYRPWNPSPKDNEVRQTSKWIRFDCTSLVNKHCLVFSDYFIEQYIFRLSVIPDHFRIMAFINKCFMLPVKYSHNLVDLFLLECEYIFTVATRLWPSRKSNNYGNH